MPERHDLILCADDFGLAADIDAGILALVAAGRLSAAGCMVAGPTFEADAPRLRGFADRIDIGLHFTLTDLPTLGDIQSIRPPMSAPAELGTVMKRAFLGRLDYDEIKAEIGRQVHRFHSVMGRAPDFIDGHQHVHVFPTVRRALFDSFVDGTLSPARTWVRSCEEDPIAVVRRGVSVAKTLLVTGLSVGLRFAAGRHGITTNRGFRGITGFDERPGFEEAFPRFLDGTTDRALVMCHPASPAVAPDPNDPIAAARRREFAYLSGEAFPRDLERAGRRLTRMMRAA